jgi:hypothetical protein
MRTDRIAFVAAAIVALLVLGLNSTPYELAASFAAMFNFLAAASVTLFLWIATRGRRPVAVPAAALLLAPCTLNPAVVAAAVLLTAGTLFFLQGKPVCAESSPR